MSVDVKRILLATALLAIILSICGCDKEKIVTSTEYVHDIEYVEVPADTVYRVDTLVTVDTVIQIDTLGGGGVDTVLVVDTVVQTVVETVTVTDTVTVTQYVHDTTVVTQTVTVTDTVTVEVQDCPPYAHFAFAAMPFHADPLVIDFINAEFGLTEGWILYLSLAQSSLENPAAGVYDFCGYVNFWAPDWSGYHSMEYCFRMSLVGDDPAEPMDWQLTDTPAASSKEEPGLRLSNDRPSTMTER